MRLGRTPHAVLAVGDARGDGGCRSLLRCSGLFLVALLVAAAARLGGGLGARARSGTVIGLAVHRQAGVGELRCTALADALDPAGEVAPVLEVALLALAHDLRRERRPDAF